MLSTYIARSLHHLVDYLILSESEFRRNSMSWLFGLGISMWCFFSLGISMSWLFALWKNSLNHDVVAYLSPSLDVVDFWSWNLDVVVYVPPRPRSLVIIVKTKKSRIIMSIMLLKNTSVVQIYATSICIIYASAN